jgi:hypothetical protein
MILNRNVEKSQSGGPAKSGSGGWPTMPDSGRKVKKGKKLFHSTIWRC